MFMILPADHIKTDVSISLGISFPVSYTREIFYRIIREKSHSPSLIRLLESGHSLVGWCQNSVRY